MQQCLNNKNDYVWFQNKQITLSISKHFDNDTIVIKIKDVIWMNMYNYHYTYTYNNIRFLLTNRSVQYYVGYDKTWNNSDDKIFPRIDWFVWIKYQLLYYVSKQQMNCNSDKRKYDIHPKQKIWKPVMYKNRKVEML